MNNLINLMDLFPVPYLLSPELGSGLNQLHEVNRILQQLPDYTSPPTEYALSLTPEEYQPDFVIDAGRDLAAVGLCDDPGNTEACQMIFHPPSEDFDDDSGSKVGVIFYGGALVDPRGYSPLAHQLSHRYGLPTTVPFFNRDLAFDFTCNTKKIELASRAFPEVEKWVLAGHSFGGIAAMSDLYTILSSSMNSTIEMGHEKITMDDIGGLAMVASYIRQDVGCGAVDFSSLEFPAASVYGDLDGVLNLTRVEIGEQFLPKDYLSLPIYGGNHGQFGSYDYSERKTLLGQNDPNATIPENLQHDMTVMGILSVASRTGVPLPVKRKKSSRSSKGGKNVSKSTKGKSVSSKSWSY